VSQEIAAVVGDLWPIENIHAGESTEPADKS
jgi:hypothetical protein